MIDVNPGTITLLVILLAISAFFSASETAYISLQWLKLNHLVETNVPGAKLVKKLLSNPERLLTVMLLGSNVVNTAMAALVTAMIAGHVANDTLGIALSTLIVTVFLLIFGEMVPKTFAVGHAQSVAFFNARILEILEFVFHPIVIVLQGVTLLITRPLGIKNKPSLVSQDEIKTLISASEEAGVVEPHKAEMIHNVLAFGDTLVKKVMVQRGDVVALEKGIDFKKFLEVFAESPHDEFPVYEEDLDNIVGVLNLKDVLKEEALGHIDHASDLTTLMRKPHFVPENNTVDRLFIEMRDLRLQMALVVDEYGSFAGLITLKQVMQEIVGYLGDELLEDMQFERINENTVQIDGDMHIEDFNEHVPLQLPKGDYETVAGFMLHKLGRIPVQGDSLKVSDSKLMVSQMNGRRIEKIMRIMGPSLRTATSEPKQSTQ